MGVVNNQLTMNHPLTLVAIGLMAACCLAGPAPTNYKTLVKSMNGEESCPGPICEAGCCPYEGWFCCPGGDYCAVPPSNCPDTKLNYASTRNVFKNIPAKGDLHRAESSPIKPKDMFKSTDKDGSCPGPICQGGRCCPQAGWYCCPGGEYCAITPSNCPDTKLNYASTRNVVKNIPAKGDLHRAESSPIKPKDMSKSTNKDGSCPGPICQGGRCCPQAGWYCCPGGEYCAITPSNCP